MLRISSSSGGSPMADLSLQQATTIVEASLRKGRETGCAPLAVAVLDAGGHLKAFAREDGAGIIRPQIATGKAWGALGMGAGSRALAPARGPPPPHPGVLPARHRTAA